MNPLAYIWVGLGGALRSMARLGLGLAVTRLWGNAFPWGTLIINVLGSFVIGFFGTLTLNGGPLPASADLRLFVMVGICGGFTTFSSFSLQDLRTCVKRHGGRPRPTSQRPSSCASSP